MSKPLTCALLAAACLLAGCRTPLEMSVGELSRLREDEGRIVGSVLVVVEPAGGEVLAPRASGGPTAQAHSYSLLVRRGSYMGEDGHAITVQPGEERAFFAKLPDGDYTIYELKQTFTRLRAEIDARFSVREGRTTYIGRLVLYLPAHMRAGMPLGLRAEDRKERDLELLSPELRELAGEPDTRLITLPAAGARRGGS